MGFFRGGLLIIVCILLLGSLLIGNFLLVLSSSLEYENVKMELTPIIKDMIYDSVDEEKIETSFAVMKVYCEKGNSAFIIQEDYNFVIPCEDILNGTLESVLDSQIEAFMQENYYKEYTCSFIECFGESEIPLFLFSEMSKNYLENKYYYFLIFSLVFLGFVFLLVEKKINTLILGGSLVIVSSLPFIKITSFSFGSETYSQIFLIFVKQSNMIFWWVFTIGILILGIGIGLKFWNFNKAKEFLEKKTSGKRNNL